MKVAVQKNKINGYMMFDERKITFGIGQCGKLSPNRERKRKTLNRMQKQVQELEEIGNWARYRPNVDCGKGYKCFMRL